MSNDLSPTILDLYPNLSEQEIAEIEDNLERYLALVLRIFERHELESIPQADPLTPNTSTLVCTPSGPESS